MRPSFDDYLKPRYEPKIMSTFLGVKPSKLPRLVGYTIGEPAEPASKGGVASRFSIANGLCLTLGHQLLVLGLPVSKVKLALKKVVIWLKKVVEDSRHGTSDDEFIEAVYGTFLVIFTTTRGVSVTMLKSKNLGSLLARSCRPISVINLPKFTRITLKKLFKHTGEQ